MRIQKKLENEFDAFSVNYTEDMTKCVPYYLDLTSAFASGYPKNFTPKHILDLGCGNGNVTAQLVKLFPSANYALVDASQDMLNLCEQRFADFKIDPICSYFKDFDFQSEYYDLVVAGFSLHHCDSDEKQFLFKKIHDSLAPQGLFSCSDLMINKNNPKHSSLKAKWQSFVAKNYTNAEKWQWLMEHYDAFDKPDNYEDQVSWLDSLGFTIIDTKVYEYYWAHYKALKH